MQNIPDSELLNQLKNEDNASFEVLYKSYFPSIAAYISRNNGNTEDAEDIFQESVIVLLHKIRQPDFVLTSSLKTFLFSIAKNLWLKKLRDSNRITPLGQVEQYTAVSETVPFELQQETPKEEKIVLWLKMITENCKRIIKAIFFYKEPMAVLMKRMGWKNRHTAANQQYKCIQQIKRLKDKESC